MSTHDDKYDPRLLKTIQKLTRLIVVLLAVVIVLPLILLNYERFPKLFSGFTNKVVVTPYSSVEADNIVIDTTNYWIAPKTWRIKDKAELELVEYGKELIEHTAKYLGPKGSVRNISNGLNCQNCHLDAGTKTFGNNYGSVASMYPKFRSRSGTEEDIPKRINDCFERSLNGLPLDDDSREMKAIVAYMKYIGSNVKKGEKAVGSGLKDLAFLDRPADPIRGKVVYEAKCASCHGINGLGDLNIDSVDYIYPPLWGPNSFNDAAGLSRLTNMAKYVKYNMPFGVVHNKPELSDTDTWDVSAYVVSQPRPHKETPHDWPDISKKPIDHPFGPYADQFSEIQHKYGPYKEILDARKK